MKNLKHWDSQEVSNLVRTFVSTRPGDDIFLSEVLSSYVNKTNTGDELLWEFIVKDVKAKSELGPIEHPNFNCGKHCFKKENFLLNRFIHSDNFISSALDYLIDYTSKLTEETQRNKFSSLFQDCTSWEKTHNCRDMYRHDSSDELIGALEKALLVRSKKNDSVWLKYEPILRTHSELGFRYIVCLAYLENVQENLQGISFQLEDKAILRYGHMDYELCLLARASYHLLNEKTCTIHQDNIFNLYTDHATQDEPWVEKNIYDILKEIPRMFLLKKYVDFTDRAEKKYGKFPLVPRIHSSGGTVRSPISSEQMSSMNSKTLIKLLQFYENHTRGEADHFDLTGGLYEVQGVLQNLTSLEPYKYLPLIDLFEQNNLEVSHILSIMEGIATHLKIRFGNLSDSKWKEVHPLPHGQELAETLLNLIEKYIHLDARGYTTERTIEACAYVLTDLHSINRLTSLIFKALELVKSEIEIIDSQKDLFSSGINSVRGGIADATLLIANQTLYKNNELTEPIIQLLKSFSQDSSLSVRVTLSNRLPYLLYKSPSFGWELLNNIFQNNQLPIYHYFEKCFYYQYSTNYNLVEPYLDLLHKVHEENSSETWGRITTLSFLNGNLNNNDFWQTVDKAHIASFKGISQVFIKNITLSEHNKKCSDGLIEVFSRYKEKDIFSNFECSLSEKDFCKAVSLKLIKLFLEKTVLEHTREIDGLFDWLELHVQIMFLDVLVILEDFISKFNQTTGPHYFYKPESLVTTLNILLQEADLSDDEDLISRVLDVQDWFLEKGVSDIEKFYDSFV